MTEPNRLSKGCWENSCGKGLLEVFTPAGFSHEDELGNQSVLLRVLSVWGHTEVFPESSLLEADQPQISLSFLTGKMFHASNHFGGSTLDSL